MNELIMTGYVATEPEINEFKRKRRRNKKTPQYGLAANFRISVKRSFKKRMGKNMTIFPVQLLINPLNILKSTLKKAIILEYMEHF